MENRTGETDETLQGASIGDPRFTSAFKSLYVSLSKTLSLVENQPFLFILKRTDTAPILENFDDTTSVTYRWKSIRTYSANISRNQGEIKEMNGWKWRKYSFFIHSASTKRIQQKTSNNLSTNKQLVTTIRNLGRLGVFENFISNPISILRARRAGFSMSAVLSLRILWPTKGVFIKETKSNWLFVKQAVVAAHLRNMRPAPTSKKDTLMLRKSTNTNTNNQTPNYVFLDYFQFLCTYTDTYLIRIHNKCTYILIRIYTEPNWSRLGRNRYGTNEYS